jgi:hypothetical protein
MTFAKVALTVFVFVLLIPMMLLQNAEEAFGKPSFERNDGPRRLCRDIIDSIWSDEDD